MEQRILNLIRRSDYRPLNATEIASRLGVNASASGELQRTLDKLERQGRIARIKQGNRYGPPVEADLIPGRIRLSRNGTGIVQPDDPKFGALTIPPASTGTAMHGDRVLVRKDLKPAPPRPKGQASSRALGTVVRVLERARTTLVGTLARGKRFFYVIPDDPRMPQDIYVAPPSDLGRPVRMGDKVVVELEDWNSRHVNPEGRIIELLGAPDAEGVDMLSVIRQYQLPLHFPRAVLAEARAIGSQVSPKDTVHRLDCRNHLVVTIDPEDAKDFDDAICIERYPDRWKVWVHIADVSHYVQPGSALDEEAMRRGNSTYLVDRVVPMLPEALSNELCSLKPGVDRLTRCVEAVLSRDGRILETRFHSAVINSRRRFNYKEAFGILQGTPADAAERMLHDAHELAQKLRRARFKGGALDLDFPERKIILDERGAILRIERVYNDVSHQLIEEFMLLANEAVAVRLKASRKPALYRIHEAPDPAKLQEFREDVLASGIPCGNLSQRHEVQRLLEKLNHLPIGPALKIGFLRSLMRARYAVDPIGHYGLAKSDYTHFTSPIRRYADLVVHRALFHPGSKPASGSLPEVADRISETERNSADAERDSKDVKLFAFLRKQLQSGELVVYNALVTELRNFGFFVDVADLGMSGMVPLSGLSDDFYVLDPARGQLIGRRTRRIIKMGDRVNVVIAKVDNFKRQVDFTLAQGPKPASKKGPATPRPAKTRHGRF